MTTIQTPAPVQPPKHARKHSVKFWLLIVLAGFAVLIMLSGIVSALTPARPAPAASTGTPASASIPASQAGPGGAAVAQTARQGQPFTVSYDYAVGYGSASWKLTLVSVTEGDGSMFSPAIMAAYYGDEGMPAWSRKQIPDSSLPWSSSTSPTRATATRHGARAPSTSARRPTRTPGETSRQATALVPQRTLRARQTGHSSMAPRQSLSACSLAPAA